jgi:hypothetical protein
MPILIEGLDIQTQVRPTARGTRSPQDCLTQMLKTEGKDKRIVNLKN